MADTSGAPTALVGVKATYRFRGEQVHQFHITPSHSEASNEYTTPSEEERQNHSYSGKMDGGVDMPALKSTGPYARLVTAIKRSKEESELFLKDKVEGPISARLYE
ncbi:TPA: hypothetical protein N0F65_009349 [Lagenidium giganteum]|uniref:Uncharacterized protein n=1 Tax=Lagenidium giganteum TaxID=4803 RepID=A0AAV2ZFR2_9STRA|nr:TPA: hypothetical protein N0F65_005796 [Lagenidium giganteum]DBA04002.1 TPA: hypothetical protein N0F65_009349 [Lagenidium giganteum]